MSDHHIPMFVAAIASVVLIMLMSHYDVDDSKPDDTTKKVDVPDLTLAHPLRVSQKSSAAADINNHISDTTDERSFVEGLRWSSELSVNRIMARFDSDIVKASQMISDLYHNPKHKNNSEYDNNATDNDFNFGETESRYPVSTESQMERVNYKKSNIMIEHNVN
jgi:hypothetical protein